MMAYTFDLSGPLATEDVRPRKVSKRRSSTCCALGGAFVLVLVIAAIAALTNTLDAAGHFSQWTNLLFLVPAASALLSGYFTVAAVLFVTFAASTVHHGCVGDDVLRDALAVDTFLVAGIGSLALTLVWTLCAARTACSIIVGVALSLVVSVLSIVALVHAPARINGCLLIDGTLDQDWLLMHVWSALDDAAAVAAVAIVAAEFFRTDTLATGAWALVVGVATAASLYQVFHLISGLLSGAIILAVLVPFLVWLLVRYLNNRGRRRHSVLELIGAALLGVAALLIFVCDNTPVLHGIWHVLAAAAALLVLDDDSSSR